MRPEGDLVHIFMVRWITMHTFWRDRVPRPFAGLTCTYSSQVHPLSVRDLPEIGAGPM